MNNSPERKQELSNKQAAPYILGTDIKAAQNLDEQHEQLAPFAFEQLKKAGLQRGMIVWDIGCGSGAMTEYLAGVVGSTGHVYALDLNPDQVLRTSERLQKKGFQQVTVMQGDITAISALPKQKADLVYARMVLMHLKYPEAALRNMAQLLKPAGILSLQESIMESAASSPICEVVEDYFQTLIALGNFNGVDFNIGAKLSHLCESLSCFEQLDYYVTQRTLDAGMAKKIILSRLPEWEKKALEAQLVTQEILQNWKKALESLRGDEFSFKPADQGHLIARKSKSSK